MTWCRDLKPIIVRPHGNGIRDLPIMFESSVAKPEHMPRVGLMR